MNKKSIVFYTDWLAIIVGVLALYSLPHGIGGDAGTRYDALTQLLETGQLSTMKYSMIGPLFSSPLWFLGKLSMDSNWWVARFNFFIFVLGLIALFLLLRHRLPARTLRIFLIILTYASMFPFHITTYYGELFTAVLVAVGIAAASHRSAWCTWLIPIIGAANTPGSVPGLCLVSLSEMVKKRRWKYIGIAVGVAGLVLFEAWLRRGSPATTGYEGNSGVTTPQPYSGLPGFSYPFFFGVLSIILSFGKGVIFYASGLFIPFKHVWKRISPELRDMHTKWLLFTFGLLLVYARWWAWPGNEFWGPRFFLFASFPASFALALLIQEKRSSFLMHTITLCSLLLSFWVGLSGIVYGQFDYAVCLQENFKYDVICLYVPEFSELWRPFVVYHALEPSQKILLILWGLVFLYLAIPLAVRLVRQGTLILKQWIFGKAGAPWQW